MFAHLVKQTHTHTHAHTHTCMSIHQVDEWHFDSFELDVVTNGRPLSTLAFALFTRSNLMAHFRINDVCLAR